MQKKILNDEMKSRINIDFDDTTLIPQLIGVNNCNLREIEGYINVEVDSNGSIINLYGKRKDCLVAKEIIEKSYIKLKNYKANNVEFDEFSIDTDIKNVISKKLKNYPLDKNMDNLTISTWKKNILPKTDGHKYYLSCLEDNDVVFCTGPAGTGKTYLAAGEKIGFLPGDIKEKVDPYLRPIYDALYDMMPFDKVDKKIISGEIEIAPLAFMRGRTLKNSYIIIDEAQNTTKVQMKMLLTRLGEGSKMVITGDLTQVDLPAGQISGLGHSINILKKIKGIEILKLDVSDIVRHPIVSKIIDAYEKN